MKHRTLIGRAGVRCADGRRARLDYYLLRSGGRFGLEVRMRRGQERCRACLPELSPTPREALRLGRTLHRWTVTPCVRILASATPSALMPQTMTKKRFRATFRMPAMSR